MKHKPDGVIVWAGILSRSHMIVIALSLSILMTSCAPDNSFQGSSGVISTGRVEPPTDKIPSVPEDPVVTTDLDEDDQLTLKSCQAKVPSMLQGVKILEVEDIGSSISNKQDFSDPYQGTEKRVLIINLKSDVANKIQFKLSSNNTIYCLNIESQITNKINIGISPGARLIEARKISLINKISTHPI